MLISFHGTFLTTMDRQYKCMCKYDKSGKGDNKGGPIVNHLEVRYAKISFIGLLSLLNLCHVSSMLPTTELMDTGSGPNCDYTIHAESANGPSASHAKVGDRIWHTWKCADGNL